MLMTKPVRLPETAREKIAAKTALNNGQIRMSAVYILSQLNRHALAGTAALG
jgi:hypothetical protein